ncbi:MAG: histidine kinase [Deltaproteobacteria bacterium]|nr:histidine kinase [Deltaproteobacteria bacterium]
MTARKTLSALGMLLLLLQLGLPEAQGHQLPGIQLDKGWQYRWGDLPRDSRGGFVWPGENDDGQWSDTQGEGHVQGPGFPPGREGRNYLWFRVTLPAEIGPGDGLFFQEPYTQVEVYLDGILKTRTENLDAPSEFRFGGGYVHSFPLSPSDAGKKVYFRIWSEYTDIGLWGPVAVTNHGDSLREIFDFHLNEFIITLVPIIIGVFCLGTALFTRSGPLLWFALFTLGAGLQGPKGEIKYFLVDDIPFWTDVWLAGVMLMVLAPYGFINAFFGRGRWGAIRRVFLAHGAFFALFLVVYVLGILRAVPAAVPYAFYETLKLLVPLVPFLMLSLLWFFTSRRDGYTWFLMGVLIVSYIPMVLTLLAIMGIIDWNTEVFLVGEIGMSAGMGAIIGHHYFTTYRNIRLLAHELALKNSEREWLMRDLHDGMSGLLVNMVMQGEAGIREKAPEGAGRSLDAITGLARQAMNELRMLIQGLDTTKLDWNKAVADLRRHGAALTEPHGIQFSFKESIEQPALEINTLLFVNLYRIFSEAVTNVVKHAQAKSIRAALRVSPLGTTLEVADDGKGLNHGNSRGRGLANMKYRSEMLGGTFEVENSNGTLIKVDIPAAAPESQTSPESVLAKGGTEGMPENTVSNSRRGNGEA